MKSQVNGLFREPTWALISNIANTWVCCCHCLRCQCGCYETGLFFETAGDAWIGGVLNGHLLTSCLTSLFLNNPPPHLFFSYLWRSKPTTASAPLPLTPLVPVPSSVNSPSLAAAVVVWAGCLYTEARGDVTTILPPDWQLLIPGSHPAEHCAGWVGAVTFGESLPWSRGEGGLCECQTGSGGVCICRNAWRNESFYWMNAYGHRVNGWILKPHCNWIDWEKIRWFMSTCHEYCPPSGNKNILLQTSCN